MHITEIDLAIRVLVGWGLTFVLGFERAVRGAPAGDRTFSLVGACTALIGALSLSSPSVLGGAVTGIGFIGGGLCFRQAAQDKEILHGVTTAASIFGAAAIGAAAGVGHIWLAVTATSTVLVSLEIRHLPFFRMLDARRWQPYFHHDDHTHFTLRDVERVLVHEIEGEAAAVKAMSAAFCGFEAPHEHADGKCLAIDLVESSQDDDDDDDAHTVSTVVAANGAANGSVESVTVNASAAGDGKTRPAISENVEEAIESEIMADQMIEAAAATSRTASR